MADGGHPEKNLHGGGNLSKFEYVFFPAGVVDIFDELTWKYLTGMFLLFPCRKEHI